MKILTVSAGDFSLTYGGGQTYVRRLVAELCTRKEIEVSILSFFSNEARQKTVELNGRNINIHYLPISSEDNRIIALLKEISPDIVHIHGNKAQMCKVCRNMNIPNVVTAHHGGILCPAGALLNSKDEICHVPLNHRDCLKCCLHNIRFCGFLYPVLRFIPQSVYIALGKLLRKIPFIYCLTPVGSAALSIKCKKEEWMSICGNCSLIIAPSYAIKQAMEQNGMPPNKIIVLPHGVPQPDNVPPFPAVKNQKVKFFYVGRICYVKGLHLLLEAFHRAEAPHAELHLIGGAGNQHEKSYMEHLKRKYRSDSRILWHGKIKEDQIAKAISSYHVLIHPTIYMETFGLNIAEALSMGKWALSTRCGGAEMQILEGKNGWLIPPNAISALKDKIKQIADSPPCCSPSIFRYQSIEKHVKSLLDIFKNLIKSPTNKHSIGE